MNETQAGDAAGTYRNMVADIIGGRGSGRPYPDAAPHLSIVRRRQPRTVADLDPAEVAQLRALWRFEDGRPLEDALADEEHSIEVAEVVDADATVRYRLYGWNFGVGYLFPPEGLDVVAFGAQHDIEHWTPQQRDLFAGMDRALRAGDHGFRQPLYFCWDDDSCWDELADLEPGTAGSEQWLRQHLGDG